MDIPINIHVTGIEHKSKRFDDTNMDVV